MMSRMEILINSQISAIRHQLLDMGMNINCVLVDVRNENDLNLDYELIIIHQTIVVQYESSQ